MRAEFFIVEEPRKVCDLNLSVYNYFPNPLFLVFSGIFSFCNSPRYSFDSAVISSSDIFHISTFCTDEASLGFRNIYNQILPGQNQVYRSNLVRPT